MIRTLDPAKYGYGAVAFIVDTRMVVGWVRENTRRDECSAWVLWDGVIYLACRRCSDRKSGVEAIATWIETVTSPEHFEHLPRVLIDPWRRRGLQTT